VDLGDPAQDGRTLFRQGDIGPRGTMSGSRVAPNEILRSRVLVRIPPVLRTFTDGQDEVLLEAEDVASLLDRLDAAFPGIGDRIREETGRPRRYVNVFLNENLVRDDLSTVRLAAGDVVDILPSIAGGLDGQDGQEG